MKKLGLKFNYSQLVRLEEEKGDLQSFFNGMQDETNGMIFSDIAYMVALGLNVTQQEALPIIDKYIDDCEEDALESLMAEVMESVEKSKIFQTKMGKPKVQVKKKASSKA